jgi:hypothetical protein
MAARSHRSTASNSDRPRVARWLDSDLVGIAATAYTAAVVAISIVVFAFAGPVAGFVVAVAVWIPMVVFAIRGRWQPPTELDVRPAGKGPRHRVLVVANRSLDDPTVCREVCRRETRADTEVMVVAPVMGSSRLHGLSDDVDRELDLARRRVEGAVQELRAAGVRANGHADVATPMDSLLDGLREFPPNEVLIAPGGEANWSSAEDLAERVRAEVGLPVTEISAAIPERPAARSR